MTEETPEETAEAKAEEEKTDAEIVEENKNKDPVVKKASAILFWTVIFAVCIAGLIFGFQPISPWIFILGAIVSIIALFFLIKGYSMYSESKNAKTE